MVLVRFALTAILSLHAVAFSQTASKPVGAPPEKSGAAPAPVQLRAVVTDAAGRFIENLSKEDFLLTENGAQQPIVLCAIERSEGRPVSVAAAQSTTASGVPASPRAIVLLVDTAHMSGQGVEQVKVALGRFIAGQRGEKDPIVLVTSSGKPGVTGVLGTDETRLKAEISKIRPGYTVFESFLSPALCGKVVQRNPQAVDLAMLILNSEDRSSGSMQIPNTGGEAEAVSKCRMVLMETASRRRALMASIGAAVAKVSELPGQSIIALFTEGFSMTAAGGDPAIAEVRPAISRAVRSAVMIYSFDAKDPTNQKQANLESYALASEILNSKRDLQHGPSLLTGQTGGDSYYNVDGLSDQLQQMLDANRISYRLGYYPPPAADPLKFRSLSLTVKGRPEYRVRIPQGYDMTEPRKAK